MRAEVDVPSAIRKLEKAIRTAAPKIERLWAHPVAA
jgi:hypothetical protein